MISDQVYRINDENMGQITTAQSHVRVHLEKTRA